MHNLIHHLISSLAQAAPEVGDAANELTKQADTAIEKTTQAAGWLQKIAEKIGGGDEMVTKVLNITLSIAGALVLLIVGFIVAKLIKKFTIKAVSKGMRDDGSSPLPKFIGSAAYYTILVIIVLASLSIFGIETTSFAAILAAAGLAIGLAFQGTLSNLAAGVMLIVFHPFKLGDFITGAGQSGFVKEISLFVTTIITLDNRTITIPNSALSGSTIDNCSTQPLRRADVDFPVPYSSDLASVRAALERACRVEGAILDDPDHAPTVYLCSLTMGGNANYQLRVWCNGADYWAVKERVTMQAKIEVDKNGVAITSEGLRRADVNVGVAYEADLDATRAALEAACKVAGVLSDPAPSVVLIELGASSVSYQLRCWCKGTDYWGVKERVTVQAKRELDKAGIEIPFPQLTISNKK